MCASTLGPALTSGSNSLLYQPWRIVVDTPLRLPRVTISTGAISRSEQSEVRSSAREIQLFGALAPFAESWFLSQPLTLYLERDDEVDSPCFVLSDNIFSVYGVGESAADAFRDYVTSLVELYQIVEKDVRDGVPHTDLEFARLNRYLQHL